MDEDELDLSGWIAEGTAQHGSQTGLAKAVQAVLDGEMSRVIKAAEPVSLATPRAGVTKDFVAALAAGRVRKANAVGGRVFPLQDPRIWALALELGKYFPRISARQMVEHIDRLGRQQAKGVVPDQAEARLIHDIRSFEDLLGDKMGELLEGQRAETLGRELVCEVVRIASSKRLLDLALDEAYAPGPVVFRAAAGDARKLDTVQYGGTFAGGAEVDPATLRPTALVDVLDEMAAHAQGLDAPRATCRSLRRSFVAAMLLARHDGSRDVYTLTSTLRRIR